MRSQTARHPRNNKRFLSCMQRVILALLGAGVLFSQILVRRFLTVSLMQQQTLLGQEKHSVLPPQSLPVQTIMSDSMWHDVAFNASRPPRDIETQRQTTKASSTFLTYKEFAKTPQDAFAAAWWMHKRRFVQADLERIQTVEGDVFIPLQYSGPGSYTQVRLARDWLDFSVEHLSKWNKMMETKQGDELTIRICQQYVKRQVDSLLLLKQQPSAGSGTHGYMERTLAIIPLGVPDSSSFLKQQVWQWYLTATIASLLKHGPRRIVVVGHYQVDEPIAQNAFAYLGDLIPLEMQPAGTDSHSRERLLFQTQVAYRRTDLVESKYVKVNVPCGALIELREALKGSPMAEQYAEIYLGPRGSPEDFDHVYMTEADQLLTARLSHEFVDELDVYNHMLVPHRIQPIPHAQDVLKIHHGMKHLPTLPVVDLSWSSDKAACCDDPSLRRAPKTCDHSFWWQCGYSTGDFHSFHSSMRLGGGSGIVLAAANEHGRQCLPRLHGRGKCGL